MWFLKNNLFTTDPKNVKTTRTLTRLRKKHLPVSWFRSWESLRYLNYTFKILTHLLLVSLSGECRRLFWWSWCTSPGKVAGLTFVGSDEVVGRSVLLPGVLIVIKSPLLLLYLIPLRLEMIILLLLLLLLWPSWSSCWKNNVKINFKNCYYY